MYYRGTMGVNTPAAIVLAAGFDKRELVGFESLAAIAAAFLAAGPVWCGAAALRAPILWGIGMGGRSLIMRSRARMVTPDRRGWHGT